MSVVGPAAGVGVSATRWVGVDPVNRARVVAVAGYSGTPLDRKLGIGPESAVLIEGAPAGFALRSAENVIREEDR